MAQIGCCDLPPEEGDGGPGGKGHELRSRSHRRSGGLRARRGGERARMEGFLSNSKEQVGKVVIGYIYGAQPYEEFSERTFDIHWKYMIESNLTSLSHSTLEVKLAKVSASR